MIPTAAAAAAAAVVDRLRESDEEEKESISSRNSNNNDNFHNNNNNNSSTKNNAGLTGKSIVVSRLSSSGEVLAKNRKEEEQKEQKPQQQPQQQPPQQQQTRKQQQQQAQKKRQLAFPSLFSQQQQHQGEQEVRSVSLRDVDPDEYSLEERGSVALSPESAATSSSRRQNGTASRRPRGATRRAVSELPSFFRRSMTSNSLTATTTAAAAGDVATKPPHAVSMSRLEIRPLSKDDTFLETGLRRNRRLKIKSGLADLLGNVQEFRETSHRVLDIDALKLLGDDYAREAAERRIRWEARALHVKEAAYSVFLFAAVFQTLSIVYFIQVGNMTIQHALLFALYTLTTAGITTPDMSHSTGFLLYVVFYIFVGIASMVILVAEMYQYLALVTAQVRKTQDETKMMQQALDAITAEADGNVNDQAAAAAGGGGEKNSRQAAAALKLLQLEKHSQELNKKHRAAVALGSIVTALLHPVDKLRSVYKTSEVWRASFAGLYLFTVLMLGTVVLMQLEGWSFFESLYFGTYVMTTVGYGDLLPTSRSGNWFLVFWVPLSVTFVSVYMGNLARYYMLVGNANTARIQRQLLRRRKEERQDEGLVLLNESEEEKQQESADQITSAAGNTRKLKTMNDVLQFVLSNISADPHRDDDDDPLIAGPHRSLPLGMVKVPPELITLHPTWDGGAVFGADSALKPSFALLVLVQERLSNIIATEIAGSQTTKTGTFVKDGITPNSFESIQPTAEKWMIPAGAQEAFRMATFQALVFVGENRLVTQGADAIFALSPVEVFDIFSELLAAMADAGAMEGWLARTEKLASIFFPRC